MKNYEIMTIADIDLGENDAKDLSKIIQNFIVELGGKITKTDYWGKRKFAYEINHKTEGFYDVFYFELSPEKLSKFKSKLKLEDRLVRYLITADSKKEEKET